MSDIKKVLSKLREYGYFLFLVVFFAASYFLIAHFDSYTITPSENKVSAEKAQTELSAVTEYDAEKTAAEEPSVPYITDTRTLKEYRGGIGIYDCFGELVGSFDINVSELPISDRESLREGIVFDTEGQMRDFLECMDS